MTKGAIVLINDRDKVGEISFFDFDHDFFHHVIEAACRKLDAKYDYDDRICTIFTNGMKILIPTDRLDAHTMKDIVTEYEYDSCFLFCAHKPNSDTRNAISDYAAGSNKLFYSFTLPKFENKVFFITKMRQRTDNTDGHNDLSYVMDISRQIAIGVASGLIVEIIKSLAYAV